MTSRRTEILEVAASIVDGDRDKQYGTPEDNFQRIADYWSTYLSLRLEAHDVAAMMVLLKVARTKHSPERADHWIDIAGYAACGGEVTGP